MTAARTFAAPAQPFPYEALAVIAPEEATALTHAASSPVPAVLARVWQQLLTPIGHSTTLEPVESPTERSPESRPAAGTLHISFQSGWFLEVAPHMVHAMVDHALGGPGVAPSAPTPWLGDAEVGVFCFLLAHALRRELHAPMLEGIRRDRPTGNALLQGWAPPAGDSQLGYLLGIPRNPGLPAFPARWDGPDIQLRVTPRCGCTYLLLRELGVLQAGDTVLFAPWTADRAPAVDLRSPGQTSVLALAGLEPSGLVFRRWVAPSHRDRPKEPMMTDTKDQSPSPTTTEALLAVAGDALVDVAIELAEFRVPLAELVSWKPGAVLRSGSIVGSEVAVIAGGRAMGWGELVRVGDELGVRITRLATRSSA